MGHLFKPFRVIRASFRGLLIVHAFDARFLAANGARDLQPNLPTPAPRAQHGLVLLVVEGF